MQKQSYITLSGYNKRLSPNQQRVLPLVVVLFLCFINCACKKGTEPDTSIITPKLTTEERYLKGVSTHFGDSNIFSNYKFIESESSNLASLTETHLKDFEEGIAKKSFKIETPIKDYNIYSYQTVRDPVTHNSTRFIIGYGDGKTAPPSQDILNVSVVYIVNDVLDPNITSFMRWRKK